MIMMKNIKHNAAQVAAPSNLSSRRRDRFLAACVRQETSGRTARRLVTPLGRIATQMTGGRVAGVRGAFGGRGVTDGALQLPGPPPPFQPSLPLNGVHVTPRGRSFCRHATPSPPGDAVSVPSQREGSSPSADRRGLISALMRIFARWQPPSPYPSPSSSHFPAPL